MISALINLLIWIVILGLLLWVFLYALENIPLPEPFGRVARVIVVVVFVLILILLLLQLVGVGGDLRLPRLTE
jgi:hypothetical protein